MAADESKMSHVECLLRFLLVCQLTSGCSCNDLEVTFTITDLVLHSFKFKHPPMIVLHTYQYVFTPVS